MDTKHALVEYLRYYQRARTRYRIHSPFVYQLAEALFEDDRDFYIFKEVHNLRKILAQTSKSIEVEDYGTGQDNLAKNRTVKDIVKRASSSESEGQLLFRLVNYLKPQRMLELGTNLGLSTLYQAAASRDAHFISLEGAPALAQLASKHLDRYHLGHVDIQVGPFEETLQKALDNLGQVDYVYLDGDHREQAVLDNVDLMLPYFHASTALVIDDIYWSEGMTRAWNTLKQLERVTLSIDLYEVGILFFNPAFREKQHLSIISSAKKPWMK